MVQLIELRTDGPHSGAYTREVARAFAETVRVLNHATAAAAGGLDHPQAADVVIGQLAAGARSLNQLLTQISAFVGAQVAAGRLAADSEPAARAAAAAARARLSDASGCARSMAAALEAAHENLSELRQAGPTAGRR
jgi:hypothetical protein